MTQQTSPVMMALDSLKALIAERIRKEVADLGVELPGLDRAASKMAGAVYSLCLDESGDTPDLTREDCVFWSGILASAFSEMAEGLSEAHLASEGT